MEFVLGVDAHRRSHTAVASDANGRKLASKTVEATTAGHLALLQWARVSCPGTRLWGIEDVRGLTRRLEADLMDAGEAVVRVPSKLTARHRASARTWGKSDPIDALAVARAVLREPNLPVACHDKYEELSIPVDRRVSGDLRSGLLIAV
ncbi:IS110 family transposase [Mycolicibacterium aromaticivorans]|uniref:IS110 family transposase n=1 Tax=Mycolicibacterium aromaticivorans TaxID=318425 RepID=UPI0009E00F5A|nr:transposase [Mycolicibacterium aromaticivorans]